MPRPAPSSTGCGTGCAGSLEPPYARSESRDPGSKE
jgi:hypothetical protein